MHLQSYTRFEATLSNQIFATKLYAPQRLVERKTARVWQFLVLEVPKKHDFQIQQFCSLVLPATRLLLEFVTL